MIVSCYAPKTSFRVAGIRINSASKTIVVVDEINADFVNISFPKF